MSYYRLLGLTAEPFSTSPDPAFFYESQEHHAALMRLMIEVRLRRGLSVILGDVGTGKTTLSRKLFQMLTERKDILPHLILDPVDSTPEIFLESLIRAFKIEATLPEQPTLLDYNEAIKGFLYQKSLEEGRLVVLLMDEAQKLGTPSLEILRILLNYETNEFKLLQLVLMGQMELLPQLRQIKNFWERISLKYALNFLDEQGTQEMIEFRLRAAGYRSFRPLFTEEAVAEIHRYTQGCPRRIAMLCHQALTQLVMENKPVVEAAVIQGLVAEEAQVVHR